MKKSVDEHILFFFLDKKEPKNQGKTIAPPFCRPALREAYAVSTTYINCNTVSELTQLRNIPNSIE
ncbi:MAG: hypothetical protein JST86_04725 [Bacteroidetes bacterium]|nr:hypothetical protein [Bacteroidota bacterium]